MSKINILDQDTINKIAAGEVVERPSSVVKELVENAIDAGATAVSIYIEGGGADLIRITDNGSGFDRDDIKLAFKKNTTSKIKNADDLEGVMTFGFRGEALSSIAAVARVELLTKKPDELTGVRYVIEGGDEKSFDDAGCPDGTTIVVRDLFFNTPVRRKFLKSAATEAGYVGEACERIALAHPEISIKFVNAGKQILATTGKGDLKEVVYLIYGRACAENLLTVELEENGMRITGVLAKPVIARGNRNHESFFLKGRYVKNPMIFKAIEEGYRTYLMQNKFPLTVLNMTAPVGSYDVNVHPAKLEVRFTEPQIVYEFIFKAVFDTIKRGESIVKSSLDENKEDSQRPVTPRAPEPFELLRNNPDIVRERPAYTNEPYPRVLGGTGRPAPGIIKNFERKPDPSQMPRFEIYTPGGTSPEERRKADIAQQNFLDEQAGKHLQAPDIPTETQGQTMAEETVNSDTTDVENAKNVTSYNNSYTDYDISNKTTDVEKSQHAVNEQLSFLTPSERKKHRIIGQLFDTYWLIEYDNKLIIIDQHAAHERVLYEKFSKELKENKVNSQLLFPAPILELSIADAEKLERALPRLNEAGYEIEHFGGRQYRILAVPEVLSTLNKEDLLLEFIDSITEDMITGTLDTVQDRIATMSCKAAVKGNMRLSTLEAEKLIDSLMELENPFHCPHGRPIEISLDKYEIEKKFKRIVD